MSFSSTYMTKFRFCLIVLIIAPFIAVVLSYFAAQQVANNAIILAQNSLSALQSSRKAQLTNLLSSVEQDLSALTYSVYVQHAVAKFSDAWRELSPNAGETLKKLYITENPYPVDEKHFLIDTGNNALYNVVHQRYHPWFLHFLNIRNYYDIFLIDVNGNVIYSVFKEADFATNLLTGPWKNTDLARSFQLSQKNPQRNIQLFFDFKPYAPSHNQPASFISQPIVDKEGTLAGVITLQTPIRRINDIMTQTAGLGKTGQSYLVGDDYLMRSDLRFTKTSQILTKTIKSLTVKHALNGHSGVRQIKNYQGIQVYSVYDYIDFNGTRWAIITEMAKAEIMAPVYKLQNHLILITLLFMTTGLIGVYLLYKSHRP